MSKEEGPMVPWELDCKHREDCTAPRCGCPAVTELVEINGRDYLKAVERWFEFWPVSTDTPDFNVFLQGEERGLTRSEDGTVVMHFAPEAARRIRLLAGPYYHAILTAYSITKEIPRTWNKSQL